MTFIKLITRGLGPGKQLLITRGLGILGQFIGFTVDALLKGQQTVSFTIDVILGTIHRSVLGVESVIRDLLRKESTY